MSTIHLKIKVMSLAAEAKIIRREERRWPHVPGENKPRVRFSLREHRTGVVRDASRHAQLAYAFLRGRPYLTVEAASSLPFSIQQVAQNVTRFSDVHRPDWKLVVPEVEAWLAAPPTAPEVVAIAA